MTHDFLNDPRLGASSRERAAETVAHHLRRQAHAEPFGPASEDRLDLSLATAQRATVGLGHQAFEHRAGARADRHVGVAVLAVDTQPTRSEVDVRGAQPRQLRPSQAQSEAQLDHVGVARRASLSQRRGPDRRQGFVDLLRREHLVSALPVGRLARLAHRIRRDQAGSLRHADRSTERLDLLVPHDARRDAVCDAPGGVALQHRLVDLVQQRLVGDHPRDGAPVHDVVGKRGRPCAGRGEFGLEHLPSDSQRRHQIGTAARSIAHSAGVGCRLGDRWQDGASVALAVDDEHRAEAETVATDVFGKARHERKGPTKRTQTLPDAAFLAAWRRKTVGGGFDAIATQAARNAGSRASEVAERATKNHGEDPRKGPTGRAKSHRPSDVVHLLGEFGRAACGARGGWHGLRRSEVTCPECRGRGA